MSIKKAKNIQEAKGDNLSNKGYTLKEMIAIIEKESYAPDIKEEDKRKLIFLQGFLNGGFADKEAIEHNCKTAINICRRIEFKYIDTENTKIN